MANNFYSNLYTLFQWALERGEGLCIRHPGTAVFRHQVTGDQKDDVHQPPDPHSPQCQQLADRCSRVAQNESIHTQKSQQDGVDERRDEVVTSVLDTWHIAFDESPVSVTFDSIQHRAVYIRFVNILIPLTTELSSIQIKYVRDIFF